MSLLTKIQTFILCLIGTCIVAADIKDPIKADPKLPAFPAPAKLLWRSHTTNKPDDEKLLHQLMQQFLKQSVPPVTRLEPVVVGNTVLMKTPNRLIGLETTTGKRIWEFPWKSDEALLPRIAPNPVRKIQRRVELDRRLWCDGVHNRLCTDGKNVFGVFPKRPVLPDRAKRQVLIQGHERDEILPVLVALNLKQEGKIRWIAGGKSGEDEPNLAGAYFLGASAPAGDHLFVLLELQDTLRLAALAKDTGKQLWSLDIAPLKKTSRAANQQRRLVGSVPLTANGMVICSTHAGKIVAVSVKERRQLWEYNYQSDPRVLHTPNPLFSMQAASWWAGESQFIVGDSVLLTPADSQHMHCLDLKTGKRRWTKSREDAIFVAGLRNRTIVVVGKNHILGRRLEDGKQLWKSKPLAPGKATVSGRGYFALDSYFLPTTSSEVVQVKLDKGTIVRRVRTDNVLGNLTIFNQQVLSHSAKALSLYSCD